MGNISFQIIDGDLHVATSTDNDSVLLALFIDNNRYIPDVDKIIQQLEDVQSGKKTFDEIQSPNVYWSFAYGTGYFECDAETAWLEPFPEYTDLPRIEMPLTNLIYLLKEWRTFLTSG